MSLLDFFYRKPRTGTIFRTGRKAVGAQLEHKLTSTSGIAMFQVAPSSAVTAGDVLVVSTPTAGVPSARFDNIAGGLFNLGIHTHYLRSGRHDIHFSLMDGESEVYRSVATISVELDGPLADTVEQAYKSRHTPFAFRGACDAAHYPYQAPEALPWFDRPDAEAHIASLLSAGRISAGEGECLRQFVRDGYLVVEDLIDPELIGRVNRDIDKAVRRGYRGYKKGSSERIERLHRRYRNVRELWLDRRHLRLADLIFNAPARPCQSLVFVCGSEQDVHSDVIHLTPFPAGYMCGIWIALQDVQPDSGELVVYPGTHRRPRVYMGESGVAKVTGGDWDEFGQKVLPVYKEAVEHIEPVVYRPRKGTVLIWHENLLHGGSARRDRSLERRSMVIHTFADGAVVYYDSSGQVGSVVPRDVLAASVAA